jgi:hypothetical protein
LLPRTGQIPTFARAGPAFAVDSVGRIRPAVHSQPRWTAVDLDGDGVREATALLLEGERTNLLLHSQAFGGGGWTSVNITPTDNAAVAPDGSQTAARVAATASANTVLAQEVVVAATAATFSVYAKALTGPTTANVFLLRNTTTNTNLVAVSIDYSTGTVAYTTGVTGAVVEPLASGWFRIALSATAGITSGDSLAGYAGFWGGAQVVGDACYLWGAQLEAGPMATSYIPTGSGTASRVADTLTFPLLALPRTMTIYQDAVWFVGPDAATNYVGFCFGNGGDPYVLQRINGLTGESQGQHNAGVGPVQADTAVAVGNGQRAQTRTVLHADGSVVVGMSVDGGAESVSAPSAATALASAWSAPQLMLGTDTSQPAYFALRATRVAAGVQPLAYMRGP